MNIRSRNRGRISSRALILGAGLLMALPSVSAAAAAADSTSLEEVVVTARKREESIQSVPVAVTAIGAEEMRVKQVRTVYDLQANTPGLVVRGGGASRNAPEYFLRGQGSSFGTPAGVILYFAETAGGGGNGALFDLASIQVLKGPQGTLFGRTSTGGAVLFTPVRPSGEMGGFVSATIGNFSARNVTGAFTMPVIGDKLSVRIAFNSDQRDGFTRSLSTGQKQDERNRQTLRVGVLAKPTSFLENYLLFQETKVDEAPSSNVLLSYNPNFALFNTSATGFGRLAITQLCSATSAPTAVASCIATRVGRIDALVAGYAAEQARVRSGGDAVRFTQTGVAGQLDRIRSRDQLIVNNTKVSLGELPVLGDVTVKNIYSMTRNLYGDTIRSLGATRYEHGRNAVGVDFINGRFQPADGSDWGDNYSNEFQVAGDIPNRLNWIVGYYLRKTKGDIASSPFFTTFNNALTFPLDAAAPIGAYTVDSRTSEKGLFGQATVDLSFITQGLHLTGGYRNTRSSSSAASAPVVFNPANGGSYTPGPTGPRFAPYKESANSYTLTADWQVNPDTLLYVSHRKGYKPGGINGIARNTAPFPGLILAFKPETLKDYEVGAKVQWRVGDIRGRSNVAAYYQNYTNLQRTEQLTNPAPPFAVLTQTNNIGAAKLKGLELENLVQLTEALTLTVNYAYLDAKYTKYPGTITDIGGVVHQLIDTPYTGVAKHQFTLDARYKLPTPDEWGQVFVSGQLYAQSGVWLDDSALNNTRFFEGRQKGYHNLNARLDWNNIGGKPVDASFFVKNIADDTRVIAIANFLNAGLAVNNAIYDEPRTYGVELRARFGANAQ
ncbi:MAG: hypothetical protein JWQ29_1414 [Phenylobacterium sp.]|nr:hypothetical protein [Phenylobacterium sp.]